MDLSFTPEENAFREEVRAWMAEHVPDTPLPSFDASREGFDAHRAWEAILNEGRWGMVTWPEAYGGRGVDLIRWLIFEEEYYAARAPLRVNQNGIFLLGPTLMEFGTEAQKARFLPKMATGEEIWAQAWSEPQAGSDMAAVRARAVREGDEYVLSGHKIWSSRAVYADWAFGLFRSDPESERHHGLSLILFPLDAEGVTRQPIHQINGEHGFAELFLDEVRVPAENILGAEGEGWKICMATAGFERGLMLRSPARYQMAAQALVALAQRQGAELDPVLRARVADACMGAEAYALSIYATASRLEAGGRIGAEASTNKIFWSELDISLHQVALDILGDRAELLPQAPSATEAGNWLDGYLFSLAGPIYAGTNEIQRNIIAERMLGLPRK
jgi:alkylation response protein AidB-like acyl-CoA dehydrogenase